MLDAPYVWTRHLPLARDCGVTEEQIDALASWPDNAAFTPAQRAALGFTEQAVRQSPIDDGAAAELRRHFSAREIVELAMVVGFYVSTALFIKALAVPAENWLDPGRGRPPHADAAQMGRLVSITLNGFNVPLLLPTIR